MAVKLKNLLRRAWSARIGTTKESFQPLQEREFPDEQEADCRAAEAAYPGKLTFLPPAPPPKESVPQASTAPQAAQTPSPPPPPKTGAPKADATTNTTTGAKPGQE